jgi:uncharacterized protein YdhG (YjbR/CyaY superfamily)
MDEAKDLHPQLVSAGLSTFAIEIKDGNIRFNLTEMGKSFKTDPKQWLRAEESNRYLECLAVLQKCRAADLVTVRMGGRPHEQGTWANDYRVALEFARWLDPMFSIQCNELIWRIMTKRAVAVEPIGGVWPVIQNGIAGYPRREILQAAGYSPDSGTVDKLKKRYPEHHFTVARIACVSAKFALLRLEQGRVRQLEIDFRESLALDE